MQETYQGDLLASALAKLLASKFIARPDIKAVQHADGSYSPTRNAGWKASDIEAHLAGTSTYGHYLLNTDDTVKLFCFDVDLRQDGYVPQDEYVAEEPVNMMIGCDPRELWRDRSNSRRGYLKYCMRLVGHSLAERIHSELEIPVAVAYSGSKGIHVYGLTGRVPASDAREGARIVLDSIGRFELERGDSLYKLAPYPDGTMLAEDPFINFSIEVYPKQDSLAGKDLGNLLRLPLGRNTKSKDPTFFMDMTSPLSEMRPIDPEWALTTDSPWKRPGE